MSRPSVEQALEHYPISVKLKGQAYAVRAMTARDGPTLMAFARGLPARDILYMRRDIIQQTGIDMWLKDLREGVIYSLIAEDEQGVAGYSTINLTELEWTSHVADLRAATSERAHGKGLGRLLAREAFNLALALDIEKIFARMTSDQRGARVLFHELGVQPEALLRDHIKDRDGNYHDLLLEACSVKTFLAQRADARRFALRDDCLAHQRRARPRGSTNA